MEILNEKELKLSEEDQMKDYYMPMLLNFLYLGLTDLAKDWKESVEKKFKEPYDTLLLKMPQKQKIELCQLILANSLEEENP